MTALRGSCVCGEVRFEIDGPLKRSLPEPFIGVMKKHCSLHSIPANACRITLGLILAA